jgi:hypothetical protein
MNKTIVHQPRVAWDGARVFVSAAPLGLYTWLSDQVGRQLGVTCQRQLAATRALLLSDVRPGAEHVEAGVWRVRLEDLMRRRPELTEPLAALAQETSDRLASWYWPADD